MNPFTYLMPWSHPVNMARNNEESVDAESKNRWLIHIEVERMWKAVSWAPLKEYLDIFLHTNSGIPIYYMYICVYVYMCVCVCVRACLVWWSEILATNPEVLIRFPELPDILRSSWSGTVSAQPREYNWGAT
jgi:hypothetical protein